MKILVTGATGFLGRHLCPYLKASGHALTECGSKNCDLTKEGSLSDFNSVSFDQIFHLAAWTQAGDFCLYHAGEQWIINQKINTHVLEWWQRFQPQAKLVSIGSSCAYDPSLPLVEENYLFGAPIESLFSYAMTKRMLYAGLVALHKQFDLEYLCVVPSTLYGPGYHTDGRKPHFIFDIIRKIIKAHSSGEPAVLWGDGNQLRELVFVDDFVKIMVSLNQSCSNDLVNIGTGQEFSIRHYAALICDYLGYDFGKIRFDPAAYVGARAKCLSAAKLARYLPGVSFIPLEEGLEKTIKWCRDNQERI